MNPIFEGLAIMFNGSRHKNIPVEYVEDESHVHVIGRYEDEVNMEDALELEIRDRCLVKGCDYDRFITFRRI